MSFVHFTDDFKFNRVDVVAVSRVAFVVAPPVWNAALRDTLTANKIFVGNGVRAGRRLETITIDFAVVGSEVFIKLSRGWRNRSEDV